VLNRDQSKDVRRIFEKYFSEAIKTVSETTVLPICESPEKFISLGDIADFMRNKEMPLIINTMPKTVMSGFSLLVSILPKDAALNKDSHTFHFMMGYNDETQTFNGSVESYVGIKLGEFTGKYQKNLKSPYEDFNVIADMCDYDRFYLAYRSQVLDMVGKRFPEVKSTFALVDSRRDMKCRTLGVYYDERRKRFRMDYNPRFILVAALEEWTINKAEYKDIVECYCFVLGFLLAHEMSHIIRHNTGSSIGTMDVNTKTHQVDNIIGDSFINVKLSTIFKGLTGNYGKAENLLSNGIGLDFSFRSHAKGAFSKFDNVEELLGKILDSIIKSMKLKNVTKKEMSEVRPEINALFPSFEGCKFYVKIHSDNDDFFRSSSTSFISACNGILHVLSSEKMYRAGENTTDEEKADMTIKPEVMEKLVGSKVEDNKTKKIGVVVGFEGKKLKVHFPDNPDMIDTIIALLKAEGKIIGL
jgi:hypothetical protein